jgi:hypothetical protein
MRDVTTVQAIVDYASLAQEHKLSGGTDQIVPRKTVVYETLVDPTVIKVAGERIKRQLFTKFRFWGSKSAVIELFSMEKYYEPFIVISGRYFIDYYRLCGYTVYIDNEVNEVILLNQKFYPEKNQNSTSRIRLEGEERLAFEEKAFVMLAENGQEANIETLPSAPSEKNPEETIAKYGIKEIESQADVDFVRKRLVCRPENLSRIVNEVFEIGERVVIYAPRFKLTYLNGSTFQKKSVEFDGVTAKRIRDENLYSRFVEFFKSAQASASTIVNKLKLAISIVGIKKIQPKTA